jgi:hypothetical protein
MAASYTQAELDFFAGYLVELRKVRFSGASRVKYRDRDTTFRSDAELAKAIKDIEDILNPSTVARSGAGFAEFGTGL